MPLSKIALLCVAAGGLALAAHATVRVNAQERRLAALGAATRASGQSFVDTLQGEHAERQRITFDERRTLALSLAASRRDRLIGLLLAAGAALGAAGLAAMARISSEIEEDRRHVRQEAADREPDRS